MLTTVAAISENSNVVDVSANISLFRYCNCNVYNPGVYLFLAVLISPVYVFPCSILTEVILANVACHELFFRIISCDYFLDFCFCSCSMGASKKE